MKLKNLFQEAFVRYGSLWLFKKFVRKYRLENSQVDILIREKLTEKLAAYMKCHQLSSYQITEILSGEMNEVLQDMLKSNILNEEQQLCLIEKNNGLLYENYLSPDGYFNIGRRFKNKAETQYILNMCHTQKMVGYEIFKAYVDNTARSLINDQLLAEIIKCDTHGAHYVLHKAHLNKEQEVFFITNGPADLIRSFIDGNELASDNAQFILVEKHYELAQRYFNKYGLRSQAQQRYHEVRKQAIGKNIKVP